MKKYACKLIRYSNTYKGNLSNDLLCSDIDWLNANIGYINEFPWLDQTTSYTPSSTFRIVYNSETLYVLLLTKGEFEKNPRCKAIAKQGNVHLDSCLEFYFAPYDNKNLYFNFEFNKETSYKIAFGENNNNRYFLNDLDLQEVFRQKVMPYDLEDIQKITPYYWGIFLKIPFSLVKKFEKRKDNNFISGAGNVSELIKGQRYLINAYKCGDLTESPHFACWAPIKSETPNFRITEYFGELILV